MAGALHAIGRAQLDPKVRSALYQDLTFSRPASCTVQCTRSSGSAAYVSDGTSPVWVDLGDGNGGGIQVCPNYTANSLVTPASASARAPTIMFGGSNPGPMNLPGAPSRVVDQGDIFLECEWNVDWNTQEIAAIINYYAFSGSGPEGEFSLRYEWATNSWYLKVRGVDELQVGVVGGGDGRVMTYMQGDVYRIQCWYRPSANQCGVRLCVNGCWGRTTTTTTTGSALAPLTSFWWGSRLGIDGQPFARFTDLIYHPHSATPTADNVNWIMFGDSTGASYGQEICVGGTYLSTANRRKRSLYGVSLAVPGQNTLNQLATYMASEYRATTGLAWFLLRCSINDIGSYTTAQWAANQRAFIAQVQADHPGAVAIGSTPTPAYSFWVAGHGAPTADLYYAEWLEMCDAIKGIGPNAITQFASAASAHSTTMLDVDGKSMKPSMTPDGGHPYTSARFSDITPSERAAIAAAGFSM